MSLVLTLDSIYIYNVHCISVMVGIVIRDKHEARQSSSPHSTIAQHNFVAAQVSLLQIPRIN